MIRRKAEVTLNGIEAMIGSPNLLAGSHSSFEEAVELRLKALEGSLWHLEGKVADSDDGPFARLVGLLGNSPYKLTGPRPSDEPTEDRICIFKGVMCDPHSLLVWLQMQGVDVRITKIPWIDDDPHGALEAWEHYRELVDSDTVVAGGPETGADEHLRSVPPPCERGFRAKRWLLILTALALLLIAFAYFAQQ